jgi:hypothetical protein
MDDIVDRLKEILKPYNLYSEKKSFFWYYVFIWKRKKLLFYINPPKSKITNKSFVVFGISHWATTILNNYPMLSVAADEVMTSAIKWKLKNVDDIKRKWIAEIIKIWVNYYKNK